MPRKNVPVPVPPGSKYCHGCKSVHSLSSFYRESRRPDGRTTRCRDCVKASAKEGAEIRAMIEETVARIEEAHRNPKPFTYEFPVPPMSVPYP